MKQKTPNLLMMAALFCTLLFSSCQKDTGLLPQDDGTTGARISLDPLDQGIMIPLAGNAFITKPANNGTETITSSGLLNWTGKDAMITTFFRLGKTGDLYLAFNASVPIGTSSIKVTVNGKSFTVNGITGNSYKKYRIGLFSVKNTGYIKVDIQGVSNTANGVFANVSDLIVYGSSTVSDISFANDALSYNKSRSGAGVRLEYNTNGQNAEWFYNEITVPLNTDKAGTNYISNGFDAGNAGLQFTANSEKRITFFVYNSFADLAKVARKGTGTIEDATVNTGKFIYLPYNWTAGTTYKFLTQAKTDGNGNTSFSSWFYATEESQWKFIASCSRVNSGSYLTGLYSALQGMNADNGYMNRTVRNYNQWINTNGNWTEVTAATFKGDATAVSKQRLDYGASVQYSAFYLKSQGFFTDNLALNTSLSRTATMSQPSVDLNTLP